MLEHRFLGLIFLQNDLVEIFGLCSFGQNDQIFVLHDEHFGNFRVVVVLDAEELVAFGFRDLEFVDKPAKQGTLKCGLNLVVMVVPVKLHQCRSLFYLHLALVKQDLGCGPGFRSTHNSLADVLFMRLVEVTVFLGVVYLMGSNVNL